MWYLTYLLLQDIEDIEGDDDDENVSGYKDTRQ
jgi:hypothetical protein